MNEQPQTKWNTFKRKEKKKKSEFTYSEIIGGGGSRFKHWPKDYKTVSDLSQNLFIYKNLKYSLLETSPPSPTVARR